MSYQSEEDRIKETKLLASISDLCGGFSKYFRRQFFELNMPERLHWLEQTYEDLLEEKEWMTNPRFM